MTFKTRLRHDEDSGALYDGRVRYMLIRPDALMGIFARLAPEAREAALVALGQSIREHGHRSAQTYVEREGPDHLLRIIEETAPELGWGRWTFSGAPAGDLARSQRTSLQLTVKNSPFVEGAPFTGKVCHAIAGMAGAVGSLVLAHPCRGRETHCAADAAGTGAGALEGADACTFAIEPAAA